MAKHKIHKERKWDKVDCRGSTDKEMFTLEKTFLVWDLIYLENEEAKSETIIEIVSYISCIVLKRPNIFNFCRSANSTVPLWQVFVQSNSNANV
jgi:hypothetical protein